MIRPLALAPSLSPWEPAPRRSAPPRRVFPASTPPFRRLGPRRATPVVVCRPGSGGPWRARARRRGGFEQAISLQRPSHRGGRDDLMLVSSPKEGALDAVLGGKPTEAGIRAELASAFPGLAMQVVTRPSANAYGPYGLAIGRNGAARCLYAWQWIPEAPVLAGGAPAPLSLRLRLCRDGVTFEAMAAAVTQLRLVPRFAGEPVAVPARARAARPPAQGSRPRARPAPVADAPAPEPAPSGMRYLGDAAEGGLGRDRLQDRRNAQRPRGAVETPSRPSRACPPAPRSCRPKPRAARPRARDRPS